MADSTDGEQVLKSETHLSHTFSLDEGSGGHTLSHHRELSHVVYVVFSTKPVSVFLCMLHPVYFKAYQMLVMFSKLLICGLGGLAESELGN